jgi:hypothetical protein
VYEPQIAQLQERLETVEKPIITPALPTWEAWENPSVPNATNNGNSPDTANGKSTQKAPSGSAIATNPGTRRSIPVKEAAQILGLSDSYVRDLRNNGTLKRSSTNANLIVMSSILAYQKVRENTGKSEGKNTDSLPVVTPEETRRNTDAHDGEIAAKPAANGHANDTRPEAVESLVPVEV